MDEIKLLTKEEIIELLPDEDNIHTFRQAGNAILGADWKKKDILAAADKYQFQLSGSTATSMGHGMAFEDDAGVVFVETKKDVES